MLHPDFMLEIARLQHQARLELVEAERLYKQIKGNQPNLIERIGRRLMAAGQQLKAPVQSSPAKPVFNEK